MFQICSVAQMLVKKGVGVRVAMWKEMGLLRESINSVQGGLGFVERHPGKSMCACR